MPAPWLVLFLVISVRAKKIGEATLFLVRHGQCTQNIFPDQSFISYFLDDHQGKDPPLTRKGEQQADNTSKCMVTNYAAPHFVFSSCLVRAQQTALRVFNTSTVHVAPYISEENWGWNFFHPGSQPTNVSVQQTVVKDERDDFSWALDWNKQKKPTQYWPKSCGPPSWGNFIDWLGNQSEVRKKVQNMQDKSDLRIAMVSHGNFLQYLLARHGWHNGHPRNAEVFKAKLPLLGDYAGQFRRFGKDFTKVSIACTGNDPDVGISGGKQWAQYILYVLWVVICVVNWWVWRDSIMLSLGYGEGPLNQSLITETNTGYFTESVPDADWIFIFGCVVLGVSHVHLAFMEEKSLSTHLMIALAYSVAVPGFMRCIYSAERCEQLKKLQREVYPDPYFRARMSYIHGTGKKMLWFVWLSVIFEIVKVCSGFQPWLNSHRGVDGIINMVKTLPWAVAFGITVPVNFQWTVWSLVKTRFLTYKERIQHAHEVAEQESADGAKMAGRDYFDWDAFGAEVHGGCMETVRLMRVSEAGKGFVASVVCGVVIFVGTLVNIVKKMNLTGHSWLVYSNIVPLLEGFFGVCMVFATLWSLAQLTEVMKRFVIEARRYPTRETGVWYDNTYNDIAEPKNPWKAGNPDRDSETTFTEPANFRQRQVHVMSPEEKAAYHRFMANIHWPPIGVELSLGQFIKIPIDLRFVYRNLLKLLFSVPAGLELFHWLQKP